MALALSTTSDAEILAASRRRLKQLRLRAARQGYDTPPEVLTEIEDLQAVVDATAPASEAERHAVLFDLVMETRQDVRRLYLYLPIVILIFGVVIALLVHR